MTHHNIDYDQFIYFIDNKITIGKALETINKIFNNRHIGYCMECENIIDLECEHIIVIPPPINYISYCIIDNIVINLYKFSKRYTKHISLYKCMYDAINNNYKPINILIKLAQYARKEHTNNTVDDIIQSYIKMPNRDKTYIDRIMKAGNWSYSELTPDIIMTLCDYIETYEWDICYDLSVKLHDDYRDNIFVSRLLESNISN